MLCNSCLKQDGCRYYKEYVSHLKPNDTVGSCEWYFKNPFEKKKGGNKKSRTNSISKVAY